MTKTPDDTTPNTPFVGRRSGEEAVRRAAQVVANRSSRRESTEKQTRRRSRRTRTTPLLTGTGLQFHYAVGILLLFTLVIVAFSDKITKKLWDVLHPAAPVLPAGVVAGPAAPAPWWFRSEVPVLLFGFAIWLYLTPGVWDRFKLAIGLKKSDERLSRSRHK